MGSPAARSTVVPDSIDEDRPVPPARIAVPGARPRKAPQQGLLPQAFGGVVVGVGWGLGGGGLAWGGGLDCAGGLAWGGLAGGGLDCAGGLVWGGLEGAAPLDGARAGAA